MPLALLLVFVSCFVFFCFRCFLFLFLVAFFSLALVSQSSSLGRCFYRCFFVVYFAFFFSCSLTPLSYRARGADFQVRGLTRTRKREATRGGPGACFPGKI